MFCDWVQIELYVRIGWLTDLFLRLTLWLFVRVVQDQICGMVYACGQMLHCALAKLVDAEDKVVVIGHTVYEILKDVDTERMVQIWEREREKRCRYFTSQALQKLIQTLVMHLHSKCVHVLVVCSLRCLYFCITLFKVLTCLGSNFLFSLGFSIQNK